jgi:hypothetical protein
LLSRPLKRASALRTRRSSSGTSANTGGAETAEAPLVGRETGVGEAAMGHLQMGTLKTKDVLNALAASSYHQR